MKADRHSAHLATVSFVRHGDEVLLHRHGPDSDRFAGLWNGVGGHVEAGEDILAAARRELLEEAGLDVPALLLRGVVHESGLLGHAYVIFLFLGRSPTRTLRPAPGLELAWHPVSGLGELDLVEDLSLLLPRLWQAREPLFVTETFDGGDRPRTLTVHGEPAAPLARGVHG